MIAHALAILRARPPGVRRFPGLVPAIACVLLAAPGTGNAQPGRDLRLLAPGVLISRSESDDYANAVARSYERFRNHEYRAAGREFAQLQALSQDPVTARTLDALINASLFASGQHDKALAHLCRRVAAYRGNEAQLAFDAHAHIRAIANKDGYGAAERAAADLRRTCGAPEFSPTFAGIPLAKMEFVQARVHVMDEGYTLRAKDREYLARAAREFTDDPYRDFAHYFLHDFGRVRHPVLLAIERSTAESGPAPANPDVDAVASDLRSRYREADFGGMLELYGSQSVRGQAELVSVAYAPLRSALDEAFYVHRALQSIQPERSARLMETYRRGRCRNVAECRSFVATLPDSEKTYAVVSATMDRMLQSGLSGPDLRSLDALLDGIAEGGARTRSVQRRDRLNARQREVRYVLDTLRDRPEEVRKEILHIYNSGRCDEPAACMRFYRTLPGSVKIWPVLDQQVGAMASGGKYLEIPSLVAQLPATVSAALAREGGASLNEDVTVATRMVAALERDDPDRIIDLAIELRGEHKSGRPVAAAQLLEHVKERFKHQPAGARAHYLYYTTVMRRLGFGRRIEPSAILGQFIERYPKDHPLMDDVILELGRFHDVYSRKWELAEALYRQVIRDHAGTNAVDNALYFIAEHHLANGNYVRAVEYYARVVAQVGARRLARLAAPRERETRKAVRGVEQLKTLKGIGLDLRPTAWGGGIQVTLIDARSSIRRDDVLQELAGKKIDRPVDFFAVASELPVGSVVKARFEGHREVLEPGQDEHRQFVIDVTIARARAVDVVEVAENDTLTLRPRPDHRANPPSATAAANAECLEVLDSATASTGHPWHRIRAGKGFFSRANGWANARYLVPSASCVP